MINISVLSDNRSLEGFEAEHGLSFYIQDDKTNLLFDTGASDLFLQNASKLGINLDIENIVVLSHGHFDHGDGLEHLSNKTLICHPGCFIKRYRASDHLYIGLSMSEEKIRDNFNLVTSKTPYPISDKITFLGEIPRINDFEAKTTTFIKEDGTEDFVIDDSGLAIETEKGLVVISGCAHAGICNIVEYAKKVTKITKVYAVIGGFHLKTMDKQAKKTIDYLKKEKIQQVYPAHCTYEPVLSTINKEFRSQKVMAGKIITL